jgi:WD40 repeat protein
MENLKRIYLPDKSLSFKWNVTVKIIRNGTVLIINEGSKTKLIKLEPGYDIISEFESGNQMKLTKNQQFIISIEASFLYIKDLETVDKAFMYVPSNYLPIKFFKILCDDQIIIIQDFSAIIFDLISRTEITIFELDSTIYLPDNFEVFDDNRKIIAMDRDKQWKIWELSSGKQLTHFALNDKSISKLFLTKDKTYFVILYTNGKLEIRDGKTLEYISSRQLAHDSTIPKVFIYKLTSNFIIAKFSQRSFDLLYIPDLNTKTSFLSKPEIFIKRCIFIPRENAIITCSDASNTTIWDCITGREVGYFIGHKHHSEFTMKFDNTKNLLVTTGNDRSLNIWSLEKYLIVDADRYVSDWKEQNEPNIEDQTDELFDLLNDLF